MTFLYPQQSGIFPVPWRRCTALLSYLDTLYRSFMALQSAKACHCADIPLFNKRIPKHRNEFSGIVLGIVFCTNKAQEK